MIRATLDTVPCGEDQHTCWPPHDCRREHAAWRTEAGDAVHFDIPLAKGLTGPEPQRMLEKAARRARQRVGTFKLIDEYLREEL